LPDAGMVLREFEIALDHTHDIVFT
jgi:hypothetical protein